MGTGIVSTGLELDGEPTLSLVLLGFTVALWLGLGAVFLHRAWSRRDRWLEDARAPAALTAVAGTAVLGERLMLLDARWAADPLLAIALLLWLALLGPVLGHWTTPTCGTSFLLTVATESLAVLAAQLAQAQGIAWLALAALVMLVLGLGAYVFVCARFDLRQLAAGRGDQWVAGGALAIATLACAETADALRATGTLPSLRHPLETATLALWAAALVWLPALVAGELLMVRPRYDARRWSTVFPVGMYGVCSVAAGGLVGVAAVRDFGRIAIWAASAVWLMVLIGMLRRAVEPGLDG